MVVTEHICWIDDTYCSECGGSCPHPSVRYLDCDDCRHDNTECIWVCDRCGEEA